MRAEDYCREVGQHIQAEDRGIRVWGSKHSQHTMAGMVGPSDRKRTLAKWLGSIWGKGPWERNWVIHEKAMGRGPRQPKLAKRPERDRGCFLLLLGCWKFTAGAAYNFHPF